MLSTLRRLRLALGFSLAMAAGAVTHAQVHAETGRTATAHSFDLTYRSFGPVEAHSAFVEAQGYEIRFEGCYAKHSEEAICGFTLRATAPLTLSNVQNLSHGSAADGTPIRTCCLFVQTDPRGYPITKDAEAPPGVAVLTRGLQAGETIGVMLRVPNYKTPPLAGITFSHGQADPGTSFPTPVTELGASGAQMDPGLR
jgi:hypothetical protein